ncbi:phage tail spike protein, partial [Streptococcus anginosus]
MLYLLDENVRTVKWNGIPLHEASSAIVKEETNGDFYLTVRYPITDTGIYQLIKEDMLIKAPTPMLGAQLFRIKKPIENDDSIDITAYHVTDDIMHRSITPISVVGQGCAMALSQMVQNAKTGLGDFSFTSDITDNRTFNTTETETLYSVLMDGKHSIVGTWEGELVRDNFALSIKRSRGANRGVVITTHKNLKSYQRTKNSQNVVTRIHARSTFKPDGAEDDVTLTVTVDSPLINTYPYINEKEYENNNAKTVDDLKKWAESKFKNDGIDKVSNTIEIEAYELDGQVVHLGDTVNLKSRKHDVDLHKKAVAYEYNALTEKYISITFDDKAGVGGSRVSSGLSSAADAILGASATAQNVAVERAVKNANQAFDAEFEKRVEAINDGIEQVKVKAAEYADRLNQTVTAKVQEVNQLVIANRAEQDKQYKETLAKASASSNLAKQAQNLATQVRDDLNKVKQTATQAQSQVNSQIEQVKQDVGAIRNQQTTYEQSNEQNLARITGQLGDKASKSEVKQTADGIREEISQIAFGGRNLLKGSKGKFKPDSKPTDFDNQVLYVQSTSIDLVKGEKYLISAKTDGVFNKNHNGAQESDNVVLWLMDKTITNYQIVSDSDTGTTGTVFTWNKPTGTYHLRVNTYHKDARKKVWEVKVEQG